MAIDRPAVAIYSNFAPTVSASVRPILAAIVGPNAILHRYAESSEKTAINLGAYNPNADANYAWPGRSAGGVVDMDYVKLYLENAKLEYFSDLIGQGDTIAPVSGKVDRIRAASLGFATNGAFERDAALFDRDVKAGDQVYIRGVVSGDTHELNTYVRALGYETVSAVVGTATPASSNLADQIAASPVITALHAASLDNCIELTADSTSYDGIVDGDINETYTIEVTQGSVGGDYTTALLRVTTASGRDDVSSVTPAAVSTAFDIGTRGLTLTLTADTGACEDTAEDNDIPANDLVVGQKWRIVVQQAFEAGRASASGTYSGTNDDTYIVEVTKGGRFGTSEVPEITVSTVKGLDSSGPTEVTDDNLNVVIGNKGVRVLFYGTGGASISTDGSLASRDPVAGLRKGDKFYINVTATKNGRVSTLVLGHRLSDELLTATDLDLRLSIKKTSILVPAPRVSAPPEVNWTAEETQIVVESGIELYDSTWTDGGVQLPLPVVSGTLYAEYREWAQSLCSELNEYDIDTYDDIPGPTHPDNPLKYAVFLAIGAANGEKVVVSAVCDPSSTDSWEDAFDVLVGVPEAYGIVPLSADPAVIDLAEAHVTAQSGPTTGLERVLWDVARADRVKRLIGTDDDDDVVLATLTDNITETGTQYTLLSITSPDVSLIDAGVQAGDIVRYLFTTDGYESTWTEFVVDSVEGEDTLVLTTANDVAITTPQKVEIWHTQSLTELATAVAEVATAWSNRRVRAVWPDIVSTAGYVNIDGYFLCAYLAGLRSGLEPNRALTNYNLSGFTDVSGGVNFSMSQIDILRNAGVFAVIKNRAGQVFPHMGLTTDITGVNQREESVCSDLDVINKYLREILRPYIGQSNVVPSAIDRVRVDVKAGLESLSGLQGDPLLGGLVVSYGQVDVSRHPTAKDRMVITINNLELPAPTNNIDVYQLII